MRDHAGNTAVAEHVIPFVKAWVTELRAGISNYPDSVPEFRQLVLQCRRPFLDVWLQCSPIYLEELLGVYFLLLEMDPQDPEYIAIVFERSLQRTDVLLRAGPLTRVGFELSFAFGKWLELIPNLSQRLAMTLGNADVTISPHCLELVGSALYKGIIVGGDWTVEQARIFVERAVTLGREKCLCNIIALCVAFMRDVKQVDKISLGHLWDTIEKWNKSTIFPIGKDILMFDKAVAIMNKHDWHIKDVYDAMELVERENLVANGDTGIIIWAAWCMRRGSRVRSIVDYELKRLLPKRIHILPMPPSVANDVDISDGSISREDVLWCLGEHTKLENFHYLLPSLDTWILSWIGYLVLYDKLDGNILSIKWECPNFDKLTTRLLELVAEERTWQCDESSRMCPARRAKIMSTVLFSCDPIQVASESGDRCLQWIYDTDNFNAPLRWYVGPTVFITNVKKNNEKYTYAKTSYRIKTVATIGEFTRFSSKISFSLCGTRGYSTRTRSDST